VEEAFEEGQSPCRTVDPMPMMRGKVLYYLIIIKNAPIITSDNREGEFTLLTEIISIYNIISNCSVC
jgi:hypothetical protein